MIYKSFLPSCILIFIILSAGYGQPTYDINESRFSDNYRQFDFWIGEWDVNLRKKQEDHTWADWKQSIAQIYPILNGKAILELWEDQYDGTPQQVIVGYSLRYFSKDTGKWHLWLNWPQPNRSGSQPMQGEFQHGRIEFFRERPTSDSTSLIIRYTFSDITDNTLRWDDAFSRDGGKTWTNNWIMEFARRKDKAPWDENGDNKLHTYRSGERCTSEQFGEVKKFAGSWKGKVKYLNSRGQWKESEAEMKGYNVLGGCAIISFLNFEKQGAIFREFSLKTFNTYVQKFEDGRLDSEPGTHYRPMFGDKHGDTIELVHQNREAGTVKEKYVWSFTTSNQLEVGKWELRDGEIQKVLSADLRKN